MFISPFQKNSEFFKRLIALLIIEQSSIGLRQMIKITFQTI